MPQIAMLNHAAWVNGKRFEKSEKDEEAVYRGKKVDELNTDEFMSYMSDGS